MTAVQTVLRTEYRNIMRSIPYHKIAMIAKTKLLPLMVKITLLMNSCQKQLYASVVIYRLPVIIL